MAVAVHEARRARQRASSGVADVAGIADVSGVTPTADAAADRRAAVAAVDGGIDAGAAAVHQARLARAVTGPLVADEARLAHVSCAAAAVTATRGRAAVGAIDVGIDAMAVAIDEPGRARQ